MSATFVWTLFDVSDLCVGGPLAGETGEAAGLEAHHILAGAEAVHDVSAAAVVVLLDHGGTHLTAKGGRFGTWHAENINVSQFVQLQCVYFCLNLLTSDTNLTL